MSNIEGLMKVNVRVRSMDKAMEYLQNVLGAEPLHDRGSDTIGDFNGATVKLGYLVLDVMAPNDPEGALANSIDKRGEGLDSICFQVKSFDDMRGAMKAMAGMNFMQRMKFGSQLSQMGMSGGMMPKFKSTSTASRRQVSKKDRRKKRKRR